MELVSFKHTLRLLLLVRLLLLLCLFPHRLCLGIVLHGAGGVSVGGAQDNRPLVVLGQG